MLTKRIRTLSILLLFAIVSACGRSTPVPTMISASTNTPSPTETLLPTPTLTSTPTEVPREPTGPQAGTTLLYNDGSTLVFIPAGTFEMGGDGKDNPVHTVSLGSYWIQKTEVTRAMYSNCFSAGGCVEVSKFKIIAYANDSAYWHRPVAGVKHEQAQSYCAWMGGRLPTEAEWEYAARGSSGSIYPWGNDEPTCDLLNFNNCVGDVTRATNYQADRSPFGILGMGGNVREWVSDFFDGNYYKNSPRQNPTGPIKGNYHAVRGGGYASLAEDVKVYNRGFIKLTGDENDLGFRCVVDNPVVYAPYCDSPSFTHGSQMDIPIDRCEPTIWISPRSGCNTIIGTVSGGELVGVNAITSIDIACEINDPQSLTCTGYYLPGATSLPITACVKCPETEAAPLPLDCPINYQASESGTYCEYTGGPWPDFCPPNSTPLNENQCVYQQVPIGNCPMGSYFDSGMNACVTIGQTPLDCADGFRYDFDQACCVISQPGLDFPVCKQDEYYSYEYGCVSLPQPGGIESCISVAANIGFCQ